MADRPPFQAPPEVTDYFGRRRLRPAFSWLDVWGEEHAHAFTVAKAVDAEVLARFRGSLDRAIRDGWTFERWRGEIERQLRPIGWWGPRQVADPTGRDTDRTVDFSSPRRLETIFWSNMRAARAAGQWERIQRTADVLPYLLYVRTTAMDPRIEHLGWVGIILPIDDPWWRTHFPPNGWGCKCSVRQISRFEAEDRLGRDGYTDRPPPTETRTFVNRRTGERTEVPVGIDPGWQINHGYARARTLGEALIDRIEQQPPEVARSLIAGFRESPGFEAAMAAATRRMPARAELARRQRTVVEVEEPWQGTPLPVAVLPPALRATAGVERQVVVGDDRALDLPEARRLGPRAFDILQDVLDRGEVRRDDTGRLTVSLPAEGQRGRIWRAVLERAGDGLRIFVGSLGQIKLRRPD